MSAWPSSCCTERRSAPRSSRWLAKAWRRTWGETRSASRPAAMASSLSSWASRWRVRWPSALREAKSHRGRDHRRDVVVLLPADVEIAVERGARRRREGDDALAPALALDGQHAPVAGEHRARQRHQLGHAQAGGVERLDQRMQAQRAHAVAAPGALACAGAPSRSGDRPRRPRASWAADGPAWVRQSPAPGPRRSPLRRPGT